MQSFDFQVVLNCPLETVFSMDSDVDRWRNRNLFGDIRWVQGKPWEEGSRLRIETRIPIRRTIDQVVRHYTPNQSVSYISHVFGMTCERRVIFTPVSAHQTAINIVMHLVGTTSRSLGFALAPAITTPRREFSRNCEKSAKRPHPARPENNSAEGSGRETPVTYPALESVNLRGHDEVALGQAVNLVGPQGDLSLAPGQQNIRMVSLFLGHRSHTVDKFQGLLKVGEFEFAMKVMFVVDHPLGHEAVESFQFLALERRNASATGHAFLVGKLFDHRTPQKSVSVRALRLRLPKSSFSALWDAVNRRQPSQLAEKLIFSAMAFGSG
jgi:hypothetical protein